MARQTAGRLRPLRRQREVLTRCLEDARLEIENNEEEKVPRPLCLGRTNWLTVGSQAAANRAMLLLALMQTREAHNVDPGQYLATSSTQ